MNRLQRCMLGMFVTAFILCGAGGALAADAMTPAVEPAASVAAPAALEDNLDNLEFASGETVAYDAATGKLQVKVYLDDAGNPAESTVELMVGKDTEITNGEKDLDGTSLKPAVEIDVEYDKNTKKATYVFVY